MENKAIAIIEKARNNGALVYAPQNLECPPLYKAEATIITARPDEFFNIQGKYMPSKAVVDRIGEAAGVDFIAANCGVKTEMRDDDIGHRTVFVGYAQGRTRLPDGSWRQSSIEEYEFDPLLRATMEAKADNEIRRKYLDYAKVARQRASTGARVRVIRQLTGMPVTLTQAEIQKPLVFSRIVQNTDFILGTKEGRVMAIAAATGLSSQLYGPQPAQAEPEPVPEPAEQPMRNATPAPDDDFALESDPFDEPAPQINPEVAKLQEALIEYLGAGCLKETGRKACQDAIDRGETDIIILRDLVAKAKAAYEARKPGAA
jgi:hypothetical protein